MIFRSKVSGLRRGGRHRRAAVVLIALAVIASSLTRGLLSHEWFAFVGLGASAVFALAAAGLIPRDRSGSFALARRIRAAGWLFLAFVLPQWIEAELTAGQGPWHAGDISHDLWRLGAVAMSLYVCTVVAGVELLMDLLRRRS